MINGKKNLLEEKMKGRDEGDFAGRANIHGRIQWSIIFFSLMFKTESNHMVYYNDFYNTQTSQSNLCTKIIYF